MLYPIIWFWN